jgi:hypothetical protein
MFLIILLMAGLASAAHFTRPSEASFEAVVNTQMRAKAKNIFAKIFVGGKIDGYLDDCTYRDRYLWVDVVKDDKTVYCGAFGHWFDLSGKNMPASTLEEPAGDKDKDKKKRD